MTIPPKKLIIPNSSLHANNNSLLYFKTMYPAADNSKTTIANTNSDPKTQFQGFTGSFSSEDSIFFSSDILRFPLLKNGEKVRRTFKMIPDTSLGVNYK